MMQAKTNGGQLGDSAFSLMRWTDAFYFLDTVILIILALKMKNRLKNRRRNHSESFWLPPCLCS